MSQMSHNFPDRPDLWGGDSFGSRFPQGDAPPHVTCEPCEATAGRMRGHPDYSSAILEEDAEEQGWAECQDCEEWFCPEHHVPDKDCHVELCLDCRHERDIQATIPR